jgi:hypothetical protein
MTPASLARLLSLALSSTVALVALRMAVKGLTARAWLPFHAAAAASDWAAFAPRLQRLVLFQVRLGGLGFLVMFVLLASVPPYLAWRPDRYLTLTTFGAAIAWSAGLGLLNRRLHRETGAATPWKGSFAAAGLLAVAAALAVA